MFINIEEECLMKKRFCKWFVGLVFCVLSSCASSPAISGAVPLDEAIHQAAQNIEARLEEGTILALLNFSSPGDNFSEYVLEELTRYLVNGGKFTVVDRAQLNLIQQEERFQLSGEVSDESAQSIGKKLGAQVIVSGGISSAGNVYRFRIKSLIVESAAVAASSAVDISVRDAKVVSLLGDSDALAAAANERNFLTTTAGADKGQIFIIDYIGSAENIIIPAQMGGLQVVGILEEAFAEKELRGVTIPNSIVTIRAHAFAGNYLTSISIPNSVTDIGEAAFYNNQLTRVTLGNSVRTIGYGAFACNQLKSLTIPNSVTDIHEFAFGENYELTTVIIPNSVKYIGFAAFDDASLDKATESMLIRRFGEDVL
jgi:hypothetical protein